MFHKARSNKYLSLIHYVVCKCLMRKSIELVNYEVFRIQNFAPVTIRIRQRVDFDGNENFASNLSYVIELSN